jgi:hypothetical protein
MKTLPFSWDPDGNRAGEAEVDALYREGGVAMVAARQAPHRTRGESLVGNERAFAVRCSC